MPMMLDDGFIDQAFFVRLVTNNYTSLDYQLQNAVANAISNAAVTGAGSCTVNVSSYPNTLVQLIIPRLINMGYASATLSGTTLTITW